MKEEKIIICDLDGTIADTNSRLHHLKGEEKNWDGFYSGIENDPVIQNTLNLVIEDVIQNKAKVIFVTGRGEEYRKQTEQWLNNNIWFRDIFKPNILLMRYKGDHRPDYEMKAMIFDKYLAGLNIIRVYDDRPSVIRMWKEKGLEVIDVGLGIEF